LALLIVAGTGSFLTATTATNPQEKPGTQQPKRPGVDGNLIVTVGMSMIIDSPAAVLKLSIANGDLAEAVAITPKEILINGKAPGETSLIVWQDGGARLVYDLTVRVSTNKLEALRQQIARDFPSDDISITMDNDTAFVRGTVKDTFAASRVMSMVQSLSPKAVNLLRVNVPAQEPQILLKVRFCDVDRSTSNSLGLNLASTAFNQTTGITTGQFGSSGVDGSGTFNLSNTLNVLLFRRDINLGVTIEALESKNLLQMLAEPNVMATSGREASFTDGGEIPIPVVQSTASPGAITIEFRPYGVVLKFLPVVTPLGTIKLDVMPEVSAPDYSTAVTVAGTTVPGFTTKRVNTSVELESGQSFVIAGLLDNSITETLNKIPGISSLPILGKLFQSRTRTKSNSELMVIVTPELVRPIPADQKPPELNYPKSWLPSNSNMPIRQPGMDTTGPVPVHPPNPTMPVEQLMQQLNKEHTNPAPMSPSVPANMTAPTPKPGQSGAGNSTGGGSQ
jgi:pilus assembly protein CpaC